MAEGTVALHEIERPGHVVAEFSAEYRWDITVDVDDDVGQVVLPEFLPRRWLFGLSLPTVPPLA